jgi:predicted Zn-dependent protease with MMP-like domain
MADERDLEIIESVYDALEGDDPELALERALAGIEEIGERDPVLSYLAGRALFELDRCEEAVAALEHAATVDPEDPEFRAHLAWALFRLCRFEPASVESARAVELGPDLPEAHYVRGLTLERERRFSEADDHFARASQLDPDVFPAPTRLDDQAFQRVLSRARAALRPEFRRHLDAVGVFVEDVPSVGVLLEDTPPLDPELLGLFVGMPLGTGGTLGPGGELPPRIYLFQRNLERHADDEDELEEQIRITLYHELGHYLGMEESQLEELDFG